MSTSKPKAHPGYHKDYSAKANRVVKPRETQHETESQQARNQEERYQAARREAMQLGPFFW